MIIKKKFYFEGTVYVEVRLRNPSPSHPTVYEVEAINLNFPVEVTEQFRSAGEAFDNMDKIAKKVKSAAS